LADGPLANFSIVGIPERTGNQDDQFHLVGEKKFLTSESDVRKEFLI